MGLRKVRRPKCRTQSAICNPQSAIAAAVLCAALAAVGTPGAFAGGIFSDDFESGTLLTSDSPPGQWASAGGAGGTVSLATSPVFDGAWSCLEESLHVEEGVALTSPNWAPALTEMYFKIYVLVTGYSAEYTLPLFRTYGTDSILSVDVGTTMVLQATHGRGSDPSGAGQHGNYGAGSTTILEDRWYCVEAYYKHCTGPGNLDGELTVWLDGVEPPEIHVTNIDTSDGTQVQPVSYWSLGHWSGVLVGKVYYDNVSVSDTRDTSVFELISPNGGEVWAVGNNAAVTWLPGSAPPATVDIELTRDGTWTDTEVIGAGVTTTAGSFSWTVAGSASTTCRVRIVDGPTTLDESNGDFSIASPSMQLTWPNGGETLVPGHSDQVTWNSTGVSGVDILLSTDGGGTFTTALATDATDDGSAYVRVPDLGAQVDTCRIRVQETGGGMSDDSDGDFTIATFLSATIHQDGFESGTLLESDTPPGAWDGISVTDDASLGVSGSGERFSGDYAALIDWHNTIDNASYVRFYEGLDHPYGEVYVKMFVRFDNLDGGNNYEVMEIFQNSSGWGDVLYLRLYPEDGYTFRFHGGRVTSYYSDYPGTSDPAHPCLPGQWHCIILQYRVSNLGESDGIIRLWLDGDLVYELTGMDDQQTPGGTPAGEASYIRSVHIGGYAWATHNPYGGTDLVDDVTISNDLRLPADLTVLYPVYGTQWAVGSTHDIAWVTGDTVAVPNVRIEVSHNNGTNWEDVIASTPNTGTYTWTVEQGAIPLPQGQCFIRVSDAVDSDPIAMSGTFSITGATLNITVPTSGEEWTVDTSRTIEWTTEGTVTLVDVLLSRDGGTTWQTLVDGSANAGSFVWTVDDGGEAVPQACVVRVRDNTDHGIYDDSEAFTIAAGVITVTQPAGGESWAGGSAQQILWTSNLGIGVNVEIALSYDGGVHYLTLTSGTRNDGTSHFGVPDRPTTNGGRIRVSFGAVSGESGVFTITPQVYSWLFQDGFESGTLPGLWDSTTVTDNSSVTPVTTPVPHTDAYCLETIADNTVNSDGNDQTTSELRKMLVPSGAAAMWCRAYVMQQTRTTAVDVSSTLFSFGGDHTLSNLYVNGDTGGFFSQRFPNSDPGGSYPNDFSAGVLADDGAWHQIDYYYKCSTVDNAPDGAAVLYYDGVLEANVTGVDNTGSGSDVYPLKRMILSGWHGRDLSFVNTFYWDDINISTGHPAGPFVVVTEPDGGEEWLVGQTADITWHVTDKLLRDVTHVDIEISRDNGGNWSSIAPNVEVATDPQVSYNAVTDCYTYTWDPVTDGGLPATPPQDLCLVRVTDVTPGNPGASDESDFNFSIGEAYVQVLVPNGGEVWGIGTDRDITWTSFGVDIVIIRVSWNGGGSFTDTWTMSASGGSYTWPVTGPPSGVCLVQIEDSGASGAIDESDAVFSIVNPTLQVTAPNGGESLNVGDAENITWNSTGLVNVHIELSRDDGTSWEDIVASTGAAAGTYAWTVTGPLSANCLVRISDVDGTPVDDSDAVFVIQGLDLTVPNGGEAWDVGTTETMTWDAAGVAQIDIELSRDDGGTWEVIATNVDATLGTYDWDVTGPGSAQCIIKISESTTGLPADQSEAVFTIAGVDVTAPNGGELWNLGENVNITWNSAGFANAHIELSRDGGTSWEDIEVSADATVGSYVWVVTGPSSTTCLVRISDTDGSPSDESNAVFEILAPTVTVTTPTTGDVWPAGSSQDITWSATGVTDVKIEVSRDGGTSWEEVVATTSAVLGSYTWNPVTGSGSTTCLVRVADVTDPYVVFGDSATFTISEIVVTAPAAGNTWCYDGDDQDITWTSIGITSNVDIAYSVDGGTTWTDIVLNEPDDGSYTWTIPNEDSTNCVVRVEETGGGGAIGLSEVFTLTPATITVSLPTAGSSWGLGTAQTVTWTCAGLSSVMIELSRDGNWVNGDGSDVETIVASTDATTGSYTWGAVTGPESTDCIVRVSDANDGTPFGESGTFTIAMASLALVSPDGGEIWSIGKTATVTWDQVGVTAVQIELSTDGGTTWTEIAAAADGQVGSYAWTLSAAASGNCAVRITAGGALTDTSVGTFWIINPNGDTDGDGFTDQEEVDGGTNPFDKKDKPPVMFHGKTGCGAGVGGGWLALVAALAGISLLKCRK